MHFLCHCEISLIWRSDSKNRSILTPRAPSRLPTAAAICSTADRGRAQIATLRTIRPAFVPRESEPENPQNQGTSEAAPVVPPIMVRRLHIYRPVGTRPVLPIFSPLALEFGTSTRDPFLLHLKWQRQNRPGLGRSSRVTFFIRGAARSRGRSPAVSFPPLISSPRRFAIRCSSGLHIRTPSFDAGSVSKTLGSPLPSVFCFLGRCTVRPAPVPAAGGPGMVS